MRIAIIGAGMTGLTAAYRLGQKGVSSVLYENRSVLGGLASMVRLQGEYLEMFYHHWFRSDRDVVELTEELGLADRLRWLPSRVALWHGDGAYDLNTPMDLLRFKHLGLLDKLRFGLSTVYLQKKKNWKPYDQISCEKWMRRYAGERTWEVVWKPLLEAKFGQYASEIALSWLWGKLHLRGQSRASGVGKEYLGYMDGSFAPLVEKLAREAVRLGCELRNRDAVRRLEMLPDGRVEVHSQSGSETYDAVLNTLAFPALLEIVPGLPSEERRRLEQLDYIGTVCVLLRNKRKFSDIYWQNISDPDMPFCGLIEHSNFVGRSGYGGDHLLYIANYVHRNDEFYSLSNAEVLEAYYPHLKRINPEFSWDWTIRSMVFRAPYAQPIVKTGYLTRVPDFKLNVPNLWSANMAQIYPEDRGMNYAVRSANRVVARILGVEQWAGT